VSLFIFFSTPAFEFSNADFQKYAGDIKDRCLVGDDAILQKVADQLPEWEKLARCLGLGEITVKDIRRDYHQYQEQKYQCLQQWVKLSGKNATLHNLYSTIYYDLNDKSTIMKITQSLLYSKMLCLVCVCSVCIYVYTCVVWCVCVCERARSYEMVPSFF